MKTALVAGGSSGIGAATARAFARRGVNVSVNGRDPAKVAGVVAELDGRGRAAVGDASTPEGRAAIVKAAGTIDHLVLALSGGGGGGPFASLDLDALRAAFEAKLWAQLALLQAALPALRSGGSVVLVTAGSARSALAGTAGLAAINGALDAVVGPLATELAPIRVNAVSPGIIRTPWWDRLPEADREAAWAGWAAEVPAQRVGEPEEVAEAIVLLATNAFVTGSILDCAGGAHLASGRLG